MDVSLVYNCFNRANLFRPTIETILVQQDPEASFEIVVVDDGSTDDLLKVVKTMGVHGLTVRYVRIDPSRVPYPEPIYRLETTGAKNPALALNVGIRQARGARVVLSSPEILWQSDENLKTIAQWPLEKGQALIGDVWDQQLQMFISGGKAVRPLHFLAVYFREDLEAIGGFEERFMTGCGFEDTEFCDRWIRSGRTFVGAGAKLRGFHQAHPRPEMSNNPEDPAVVAYRKNAGLYQECLKDDARRAANVEWAWGSSAAIIEEWNT